MKVVKCITLTVMMCISFSVQAVCPTQETTAVFINGVWTKKKDAENHSLALEAAGRQQGLSSDCVHFQYSHTQDNGKISDIVEAMVQKSVELNVDLLDIVRAFFLAITISATQDPFLAFALDAVVVKGYEGELALNEAQAVKHLDRFRSLALNLGHRGIMVTHSQGGLYGNRVFDLLTLQEKGNTRMVSVVTPAAFVADIGPNTRLSRDGVANRFFLAAVTEGMIQNVGRLCDKEGAENGNSWPCHQFEEGYLHDIQARQKIVNDIIAALPQEASGGTVSGVVTVDTGGGATSVSGAFLSICTLQEGQFGKFCDVTLASTTSVSSGGYQFTNLPPCDPCRIWAAASVGGSAYVGQADFSLPANGTATVGVLLGPLIFN